MCGIAGLVGRRQPERLQAMLDLIAHRGPDDQGQTWVEASTGWVGLGNRRLSVLDLTRAGHQPMERDGRVLAFNGEVYNFRELRRQLEQCGERFVSGTDTEVVLAVLNHYGTDGLRRLNGMFALAWWDPTSDSVVVARDRFGIKPLYYSAREEGLVFASEAKSVVAVGPPPQLETAALPSYLAFGWVPGDRTLFRGVRELPPGHVLRWSRGSCCVEPFRDTAPRPEPGLSMGSAAAELQRRLSDAVDRQLVADVPVGVLLSGGLDSTAVAALAARTSSKPVTAYTIAFREEDAATEQNAQDAYFAQRASDQLGLDLREIRVSPRVSDLLDRVSWHIDDPVADPAAILTLMISEAAASEVTVLLSGHGSDELFAGYRVYIYHRVAELLRRQPGLARDAESRIADLLPQVAQRLPQRAQPGLFLAAHRASRMVLDHLDDGPEDRYLAFRSGYYFPDGGLGDLLTPEVREAVADEDPASVHRQAFVAQDDLDFLDRMLYVDFKTFLASDNLPYSDRMSMAASVEMRVPFLDDAVADFALSLPENLKLRGLRGKAVLRASMRGVVPDEVLRRRKAGFGLPIRAWLGNDLLPLVNDLLSSAWLHDTGLFCPGAVRRLVDEHRTGAADHTYRIWTLLTFALWWQTHISKA